MPSLTSAARWERFAPAVGNNHLLPENERFYLEVMTGLTRREMDDFIARLKKASDDKVDADEWLAIFASVVRMGSEPLVIDGKPIATLRDYIELAAEQSSGYLMFEVVGAVRWFNEVEGARALFYERLSGGLRTTPKAQTQTAAARSGK